MSTGHSKRIEFADSITLVDGVAPELFGIITAVYISDINSVQKEFLFELQKSEQNINYVMKQIIGGNLLEAVKRVKFLSQKYYEDYGQISEDLHLREAKEIVDEMREPIAELRNEYYPELTTV